MGLARYLGRKFDVSTAKNVDEAKVHLSTVEFHAVLVDHHMMGTTGTELLEELQRHAPKTARVLMSGDETVRVSAKRRSKLVDAFVLKPATLAEIEACIGRAVKNRR